MDELMHPAQKLVYAYDAFISYNSKDSQVVERISRLLEDYEGLSIWKDNWELAGGDDWIDALPQAIVRSRAIVAFIGSHGLGPWHREEIKVGLQRAVEQETVRLIPVALPGAPANLELPSFLKSRHIVDMRIIDSWSLHLLRCGIVGARPGRRDTFSETTIDEIDNTHRRSHLHIIEWSVACMRLGYEVKCRVANVNGIDSIVVKTAFVRVHQLAEHPIITSLPVYRAPIGQTRLSHKLVVPNTKKALMMKLESERYLIPGEVEDIVIPVDVPMGLRTVISFGVHWLIAAEPLYRLAETGYLAIGQRGTPGVAPPAHDSYYPGQHNMDKPRVISTPDWPNDWPNEVSLEEWEYYGAGEHIPAE
jgi:hypothetical protein